MARLLPGRQVGSWSLEASRLSWILGSAAWALSLGPCYLVRNQTVNKYHCRKSSKTRRSTGCDTMCGGGVGRLCVHSWVRVYRSYLCVHVCVFKYVHVRGQLWMSVLRLLVSFVWNRIFDLITLLSRLSAVQWAPSILLFPPPSPPSSQPTILPAHHPPSPPWLALQISTAIPDFSRLVLRTRTQFQHKCSTD